jgi:hypothetical protein
MGDFKLLAFYWLWLSVVFFFRAHQSTRRQTELDVSSSCQLPSRKSPPRLQGPLLVTQAIGRIGHSTMSTFKPSTSLQKRARSALVNSFQPRQGRQEVV